MLDVDERLVLDCETSRRGLERRDAVARPRVGVDRPSARRGQLESLVENELLRGFRSVNAEKKCRLRGNLVRQPHRIAEPEAASARFLRIRPHCAGCRPRSGRRHVEIGIESSGRLRGRRNVPRENADGLERSRFDDDSATARKRDSARPVECGKVSVRPKDE